MKTLHLVCSTLLLLVWCVVGEENVWWDEDVSRHLDVMTSRSQAPSSKPSSKPSARPSARPSISAEPSRSFQPTYPQEECNHDTAMFPFCYNGQGGGRFGYSSCLVMKSSVNCGRYDFQILGTNYSTAKPINFTKCSNVWTWFANCIAASFPTCRRTNFGIFRGYSPDKFSGPSRKDTKGVIDWEVTVEGSLNCKANCNEGANRWWCRDKEEADGILAFARWVAGYRRGDVDKVPSNYSLFTEPVSSCQTAAPTHSEAPTASPAPTVTSSPSCANNGYPPYVANFNNSVMSTAWGSGLRDVYVRKDCVYGIRASGPFPEETFDDPLTWLNRSASTMSNRAELIENTGKFTGLVVPPESWVLNDQVEPFTVTLRQNPGYSGNLTFQFLNPAPGSGKSASDKRSDRNSTARNFHSFWVTRTRNSPNIWRTVLKDNLKCGSGPLCFDDFPRIRCSVDVKSQNCGPLDFITTPSKKIAGPGLRTTNVHTWFHRCIQDAYVNNKGPCRVNPKYPPSPYNFADMDGWSNRGSVTANWTMNFQGKVNKEGRVEYECPRGDEGQAIIDDMKRFYDHVRNAGYFTMKPTECTKAPTPSPTICAEEDSLLNNPPIYIALVVDTSYSTYRDNFGGTAVGDQNKDGKANTISDAAIAASKALLTTILEMDNLNNTNTNIGLVLFDTNATYIGNFNPLNDDNSAVNPALLATLEGIKIATSEQEVLDTNKGWTNIDDGLDKAILYFNDTSRPVFKNAFKLMVFLSDGKPTVMGDGDNEPFCTTGRADCTKASASTISKCTSYSQKECTNDPLRFCVLGSGYDTCEDQHATKMYASELAALEGVTRVAIGIGPNSDVSRGSALELIDNDPVRINYGLQPRRVMDAGGLIAALRDLCPQSTPNPTRSPSSVPSMSPSRMPSGTPTSVPSRAPSRDPSPGPTIDICEYDVIDFSTKSENTPTKTGESLSSLEYEEYGMMIEAIPAVPRDSLAQAKLGRSYYYDSGDAKAGMVLVVPAYNDTTKISPFGGSIIITLAMVQDEVMKFDLWNASMGATVESRDIFGEPMATQVIPYTATPNSTLTEVTVPVSGVRTIVISFVGKSGLSTIELCRDPLKTKSPSGWRTPEPTNEPTPGPTAGPTSGPTAGPTEEFRELSEPTSGPTAGPTAGPTEVISEPTSGPTAGPTSGPTIPDDESECPDDIQYIPVISENLSELDFVPFTIKSRGLSSVVLTMSEPHSTTVSKVFVEFVNGYARQCLAYDYLEWDNIQKDFEIQCMHQVPLSIVTVYMVDETVVDSSIVIPKCCHADPPPGSNVVKYTFKIYCVSQCPEDE